MEEYKDEHTSFEGTSKLNTIIGTVFGVCFFRSIVHILYFIKQTYHDSRRCKNYQMSILWRKKGIDDIVVR